MICDTSQTIVDVARQADSGLEGFTHLEDNDSSRVFCAKCEVSVCVCVV